MGGTGDKRLLNCRLSKFTLLTATSCKNHSYVHLPLNCWFVRFVKKRKIGGTGDKRLLIFYFPKHSCKEYLYVHSLLNCWFSGSLQKRNMVKLKPKKLGGTCDKRLLNCRLSRFTLLTATSCKKHSYVHFPLNCWFVRFVKKTKNWRNWWQKPVE